MSKKKENRKTKILVIGSEDHAGVKCVQWDEQAFPNVADFDIVILTMTSLTDDAMLFGEKNFFKIKKGLVYVLNSKGTIFAICTPFRDKRIPRSNWGYDYYTNYDWCPFGRIPLVEEKGDTLKILNNKFQRYMNAVKKWSFYFEGFTEDQLRHLSFFYGEQHIKINQYPIAQNRYNKDLARAVTYDLHQIRLGKYLTKFEYSEKPERTSGILYLLPPPTEVDIGEAINILLEDFCGRPQKTLPPLWIKNIPMPRLEEFQQEITKRRKRIEELTSEINGLNKQKHELEQFKQLLYESGPTLQEIVKLTFKKFGGGIKPPKFREEYVLRVKDRKAVIEVKGKNKSIAKADLRQLDEYVREYEIQLNEKVKGIFVGNAWRLRPLNERDTKDRPIFPEDVIDFAVRREIGLVSTIDLFNAFCAFLEGKIQGKDILKRLFNQKGIITF